MNEWPWEKFNYGDSRRKTERKTERESKFGVLITRDFFTSSLRACYLIDQASITKPNPSTKSGRNWKTINKASRLVYFNR